MKVLKRTVLTFRFYIVKYFLLLRNTNGSCPMLPYLTFHPEVFLFLKISITLNLKISSEMYSFLGVFMTKLLVPVPLNRR